MCYYKWPSRIQLENDNNHFPAFRSSRRRRYLLAAAATTRNARRASPARSLSPSTPSATATTGDTIRSSYLATLIRTICYYCHPCLTGRSTARAAMAGSLRPPGSGAPGPRAGSTRSPATSSGTATRHSKRAAAPNYKQDNFVAGIKNVKMYMYEYVTHHLS